MFSLISNLQTTAAGGSDHFLLTGGVLTSSSLRTHALSGSASEPVSPLFSKLGLHLPHPIHSQGGKAQFFSERGELEVTLPMKRPMDLINMP